MNKKIRFFISGVFLVLLTALSACGQKANTTSTTPLVPGPHSSILVGGNINIAAMTNQDYAFTVDANMRDVTVSGSFDTFGGAPNSIRVFVMDDATYNAWIKGKTVPQLSDSGALSSGDLSTAIPGPGIYHLTFSNTYPAYVAVAQQVKVNILLKWNY